jgi:hypothetical protein
MPRITDAATIAAISAGRLAPAVFVDLNFTTGPVYIWSGVGPYTVAYPAGSITYQGIAGLLGFADIDDGSEVNAKGIAITVSGIDPTLLPGCLDDYQLGLPAVVHLGFFEYGPAGFLTSTLVGTPVIAWSGRMDQPEMNIGRETASILIKCENRLIDMNVRTGRVRTNEDQQMVCPGDQGFIFVDGLSEMTAVWGEPITTNNL